MSVDEEPLELKVNPVRFRQYFAAHEVEAWLLSSKAIFPEKVSAKLPDMNPEEGNDREPPAALRTRLYKTELARRYGKAQDGVKRFAKLDPEIAHDKCPHFSAMLDEIVLAKEIQP